MKNNPFLFKVHIITTIKLTFFLQHSHKSPPMSFLKIFFSKCPPMIVTLENLDFIYYYFLKGAFRY